MNWTDIFPSWQDDGKRIAAMSEAGQVTGILTYEELVSDGEGNEWPLWLINLDDGKIVTLIDYDKWKLID